MTDIRVGDTVKAQVTMRGVVKKIDGDRIKVGSLWVHRDNIIDDTPEETTPV